MTRDAREIEREGMLSDRETLHAEKRELRAENERLKAALHFYARKLNYDASPTVMILHDGGAIARAALEPKP
jgi:hypothetical protein